jgi:hypothetical protein
LLTFKNRSNQHASSGPSFLVGELAHEQCERLGVTRDPQRSRIHRLEANIVDQAGGNLFATRIVAAVDKARSMGFVPRCVDAEKRFARDRVKGTKHFRFSRGVPARALPFASLASLFSFSRARA